MRINSSKRKKFLEKQMVACPHKRLKKICMQRAGQRSRKAASYEKQK